MCSKAKGTGANTSPLLTFSFGEISTCAWVHHLTTVWCLRCFLNFFTCAKTFVCVAGISETRNGLVIQSETFALHNRCFYSNNTNGSEVIELLLCIRHVGVVHIEIFETNEERTATRLHGCICGYCGAEIAEVQYARGRRSKPSNH
jgi:hypothetical protein